MDQKQYEEDLKKRQEEHLNNVFKRNQTPWQPCLHDSCPSCIGTGIKRDGSPCVHYISCPCPKCSPGYLKINYFMASNNFDNPKWFDDSDKNLIEKENLT